jgi:peroxiredoxin
MKVNEKMANRISRRTLLGAAILGAPAIATAGNLPRPAKPLQFKALDGSTVSMEKLRGKAVLVMFFSTDCPHCQQAAARMAPVFRELRPMGFEIIGLAMNPGAEANLRSFVQKYDVEFPVGVATRNEFAEFAELSLMQRFYYPYFLYVDPKGVVREEKQGSDRAYFADLEKNLRASVSQLLE